MNYPTEHLSMDSLSRLPSLPSDLYATHEVLNQATPFVGHNAFSDDTLLREIAAREKITWAEDTLNEAGRCVASAHVSRLARDANRHLPELKSHDRFGNRVDQIEFHPAWHELMSLAIGQGTHALSWTAAKPGAHVARGMLSYLWNQGENGILLSAWDDLLGHPGVAPPAGSSGCLGTVYPLG